MRRLVTTAASEVEFRQARYLLRGRIPFGELTVLAGTPGQGKSTLCALVGAHATWGTIDGDLEAPVSVLYVSAEDSPEHTLGPRFAAAGADLSRVHFVRHVIDAGIEDGLKLPDDTEILDQAVAELNVWVVIIDPIVAMINANLNSHRDQHVRLVLARIAKLAERHNAAVIGILHLNKDESASPLNRISGSIGFGAAARSVLLFGADPEDPDGERGNRRVLVHAKHNLGPLAPSLAYRIETRIIDGHSGPIEASVLVDHGESATTTTELLNRDDEPAARNDARAFLLAELADGPVSTLELKRRADELGIAWRTLERAAKGLNARSRKTANGWCRELPNTPTPPTSPKPPNGIVDTLGTLDPSKDANNVKNDTVGRAATSGAELDADTELARLATKRLLDNADPVSSPTGELSS
jgi:putative DNA primase/helicase